MTTQKQIETALVSMTVTTTKALWEKVVTRHAVNVFEIGTIDGRAPLTLDQAVVQLHAATNRYDDIVAQYEDACED